MTLKEDEWALGRTDGRYESLVTKPFRLFLFFLLSGVKSQTFLVMKFLGGSYDI